MDRFDELYKKLMESMTSNVFGTPVGAPPIGSTVAQLHNSDSYAPNDMRFVRAIPKVQRRNMAKPKKKNK